MDEQGHHEELIKGVTQQMEPVLEHSQQAIYIYLDDVHKVCNKKFADLLGYASPQEWADTEAPLADVIEADQEKVVNAYRKASEKMAASSLEISTTNVKTGKKIKINVIMAPICHAGHVFVAHFISKV